MKMNTKLLMTTSALFMGMLGIAASFLPREILAYLGAPHGGVAVVLVQVTGALYLGFAMLNWMARENLIGGIYSRPVALGNFFHFAVAAMALLKALMAGPRAPELAVGAVAYAVFAAWFGWALFTHPVKER